MSFWKGDFGKSSLSIFGCSTRVGVRRCCRFIECSVGGLDDSLRLRCELAAEYGAVVTDGRR